MAAFLYIIYWLGKILKYLNCLRITPGNSIIPSHMAPFCVCSQKQYLQLCTDDGIDKGNEKTEENFKRHPFISSNQRIASQKCRRHSTLPLLAVLAHSYAIQSRPASNFLLRIAPAEHIREVALALDSIKPRVAIYRLSEVFFDSTGYAGDMEWKTHVKLRLVLNCVSSDFNGFETSHPRVVPSELQSLCFPELGLEM